MARIQKRATRSGQPTYVVKWRTPDGTDRSKGGFTTRKAANAYRYQGRNAGVRGGFDPNAGGLYSARRRAAWLVSRPDLKETTRAAYADALAPTPSAGKDGQAA